MRREILKLSAGWVLCAAAWGAGAGEKTVANKGLGCEITFPDSWQLMRDPTEGSGAIPQHVSAPAAGATGNAFIWVDVAYVSKGVCAKDLAAAVLMDGHGDNYELVGKTEEKVGGTEACKVTFYFDSFSKKDRFQCVFYFLVKGGYGYMVCTRALKSDYGAYAKEINAIVASFKIIEAK